MTNPVEQICNLFSFDTHTPSPTTHPHTNTHTNTHTRLMAEASKAVQWWVGAVGGRQSVSVVWDMGYGMRLLHCGSGFYRDVGEAQSRSLTWIIALPL